MKAFEQLLENILWQSRLLVFIAVVASVILAVGVLFISAIDSLHVIGQFVTYIGVSEEGRSALRLSLITGVIEIIDGFLLAAVLIIFSLGLYELFINKIDAAEKSEFAARLLLIKSFDDLKTRLSGVVMLILVVKFFQNALSLKYKEPLELLMLAVGIVLVSAALYLTGRNKGGSASEYKS